MKVSSAILPNPHINTEENVYDKIEAECYDLANRKEFSCTILTPIATEIETQERKKGYAVREGGFLMLHVENNHLSVGDKILIRTSEGSMFKLNELMVVRHVKNKKVGVVFVNSSEEQTSFFSKLFGGMVQLLA